MLWSGVAGNSDRSWHRNGDKQDETLKIIHEKCDPWELALKRHVPETLVAKGTKRPATTEADLTTCYCIVYSGIIQQQLKEDTKMSIGKLKKAVLVPREH